mgnify:CR=1 FL=1
MGDFKPWQLAVVVIGMLVLVGSVVYQCQASGRRVSLADSVIVADVLTGDLFESDLPSNKSAFFPAVHPVTKTSSLLPAFQKDGKWYLYERYLVYVERNLKQTAAALVDPKTGELKVTSDKPKQTNLF